MIGCNVVKLFTPAVFFKDMGSIPGKCKHRTPDMFSNVYTMILTYATYGCVIWISEHTCYYCSLIFDVQLVGIFESKYSFFMF